MGVSRCVEEKLRVAAASQRLRLEHLAGSHVSHSVPAPLKDVSIGK